MAQRRKWSETDIEYLKEFHLLETVKKISQTLSRKPSVVRRKLEEMGLKAKAGREPSIPKPTDDAKQKASGRYLILSRGESSRWSVLRGFASSAALNRYLVANPGLPFRNEIMIVERVVLKRVVTVKVGE